MYKLHLMNYSGNQMNLTDSENKPVDNVDAAAGADNG